MTKKPEIGEPVQIGKHGREMAVVNVFPFAKAAVVADPDGTRHIVDWDEILYLQTVTITNWGGDFEMVA